MEILRVWARGHQHLELCGSCLREWGTTVSECSCRLVIVGTELCLHLLPCLLHSFAKFFIYYVGNGMALTCGLLLNLSMFVLSTSLP